jgi:DNA-binding transcriptional MocR family regulator
MSTSSPSAVAAQLLPRIDDARALRQEHLRCARDHIVSRIEDLLPTWEITVPAGGASLWIRLPDGSATTFSQQCERHGISLLPGPTFSAVNGLDEYVRIAFSHDEAVIRTAVDRLAEVWRQFVRRVAVPVSSRRYA